MTARNRRPIASRDVSRVDRHATAQSMGVLSKLHPVCVREPDDAHPLASVRAVFLFDSVRTHTHLLEDSWPPVPCAGNV